MSQPVVALIDSDAGLSGVLAQELPHYGVAVETPADANELMARKNGLPQLVVLCIDPKRTGWAMCNKIRKSAMLKNVPLVVTSSEATEHDFDDHRKLKTRADAYLHKPFTTELLVQTIGGLIAIAGASEDVEIQLDPDEISIEEEGLLVEEEPGEVEVGHAASAPSDSTPSTGTVAVFDDAEEQTRVSVPALDSMLGDDQRSFAAESEGAKSELSPFRAPPNEAPLPGVTLTAEPGLAEDLDLGLDDVAEQAALKPHPERPRRASSPWLVTSAPMPEGSAEAAAEPGVAAELESLRQERDRLARELEELRGRAQRMDTPATAGFSREREFLNLREIINKKEKEILDLRDTLDSKERQSLDGKDKLRELERKHRDLDEKALATERELVSAKEKIEALAHDKERVVERERQVKARLEDALKSIARYEDEVEGWKRRHAQDVAALEQRHQQAIESHQAEMADTKRKHQVALDQLIEQQVMQLRELVDQHEQEKATLIQQADAERGRMEADHAQALAHLRDAGMHERDGMRLRHESETAALAQKHDGEMEALRIDHAADSARIQDEHEEALRQQQQQHTDEVAGLRSRHAASAAAAERKHAEELEQLREAHETALTQAEQRRVQELAAAESERQRELAQMATEHAREREQLERDHQGTLLAMDERKQVELKELGAAHAAELERVKQELTSQHADELKSLRELNSRKLQTLEETHADLKAGMQQRHAQQIEELNAQHAEVVAQYDAAIKERDTIITDGNRRIGELEEGRTAAEKQSKVFERHLGETQAKLNEAMADIAERDARLTEQGARIGELEQESAGYQDQILKAYQRIKSDENIVQRAKKALAIALTLLDESAPDGGDEAAS